ncbi:MAG: hypothetical protein J6Z02_00920 [Lachnospiraceae bacterium]|nr:hypothetical protein [Lachnospiraceae bacterium]
MLKTTEDLFKSLEKEMEKKGVSYHTFVKEGIITNGEYKYILHRSKNSETYSPKIELIIKICNYLGITLNDLQKKYKKTKRSSLSAQTQELLRTFNMFPAESKENIVRLIKGYVIARNDKFFYADVFGSNETNSRDYLLERFLRED